MPRIRLPQISPRAWEHPADAAALEALRQIPVLDQALRALASLLQERALRIRMMGDATEVTPSQAPRLDRLYTEALEVLDAPQRVPLYIVDKPGINAAAGGLDQPLIYVHAETAHALKDDEIRVVLAHELGHVLSQHLLYKALLRLLLSFTTRSLSNPAGALSLVGLIGALQAWDRRSELSADRCAALVAQSPEAVQRTLLMAVGMQGMTVGEARAKLVAEQEALSPMERTWRDLKGMVQTHPQPLDRLDELDRWIHSGEYRQILEGDYPRREQRPDPADLVRERASALAAGLQEAVAPIAALFSRGASA